ncbi:MAG TPA: rhomboid family intramembrane serine protease [Gammaproteobacteria bacterium]
MELSSDDLVVVSRGDSERELAELALVLTARGIEHRRLLGARGEWLLAVPSAQAGDAARELAAYRAERRPAEPLPPLRALPGAWPGVAGYGVVLILVAAAAGRYAFGLDWAGAGRLVAGRVLDGEWWRAVTALTLHADTGHLASNLGFGAFFGWFVGRYFGGGVGWLAILGAGALGNLLNALIQPAEHASIGASTSVFGALGLLTAHAWRRGSAHGSWRARLAPIAAGVGLLAFTGTGGENTDIFAHLMGFVAGFGLGAALARTRVPSGWRAQAAFGAAAIAALALAWVPAFAGAA